MRADRLLSLLMLLQTRGKMTASELADTLEVSERTIYRDIDALSMAGVPVYGESGPEGGFALLDNYRTNLTGLTENEVRALFMLSIPAPLADLGVTQELRAALLKLAAALPAHRRGDEERVRQRFHLDSTWGPHERDNPPSTVPHLRAIQQAVWQDRRTQMIYQLPFVDEIEQIVDPYGLVARGGVWHLVYAREAGQVRVLRVSDLVDVRVLNATFIRPAGFDLVTFWQTWCAEQATGHAQYTVIVRVAPRLVPWLPRYFGHRIHEQITQAGPPDAEGWITLELRFESLFAARDRLLDLGSAIEVLEPRALRRSLVDVAQQIIKLYNQ